MVHGDDDIDEDDLHMYEQFLANNNQKQQREHEMIGKNGESIDEHQQLSNINHEED